VARNVVSRFLGHYKRFWVFSEMKRSNNQLETAATETQIGKEGRHQQIRNIKVRTNDNNLTKASIRFIVFALNQMEDIHHDIVQVISFFLFSRKTMEWDTTPEVPKGRFGQRQDKYFKRSNNNKTFAHELENDFVNRSMIKESIKFTEVIELEYVLESALHGRYIFEVGICTPAWYKSHVQNMGADEARDTSETLSFSFNQGSGRWLGITYVIKKAIVGEVGTGFGYQVGEKVKVRVDMANKIFSFYKIKDNEFLTSVCIPQEWTKVKLYASFAHGVCNVQATLLNLHYFSG
jgi:hypothetical protein